MVTHPGNRRTESRLQADSPSPHHPSDHPSPKDEPVGFEYMSVTLPRIPLDQIDLSDPEFWTRDRSFREGAFKTLRDERPFAFFEERVIEGAPFPPGPGYYAVTRHDDIWHISRNPQLFCSGFGSNIGDLPVEMNEFFGSMINMDDPKHFRLRNIVSRGFTPKEITQIGRAHV